MKLTIIIPVYNAENSLSVTLDSVVLQDTHGFEVEIWVYNDGSTDNTAAILDDFVRRYPAIKGVHLENQGVYKTRNYALEKAHADYVWLIDGDDRIYPNALQILFETVVSGSPEVVHFGYRQEQVSGAVTQHMPPVINQNIDGFTFLQHNDGRLFLWNNIYKLSFLRAHKLHFLAKSKSLEDSLFNLQVFCKAHTVHCIAEVLYLYQYNPSSISKKRNQKHLEALAESSFNVHTHTKILRDSFQKNTREYEILHQRWSHSLLGFFYSLYAQKYPISNIKSHYKKYSDAALIPVYFPNPSNKIRIFQTIINHRWPFLWLCRIHLLKKNRDT